MSRTAVDLLQGTLDLIVLKALSWGPMHGFGLARWIQLTTEDALQIEEGSLYPALYRMENRGWIKAQWALTENGRRAKYYRLTAVGRRQLAAEAKSWQQITGAIGKIMAGRGGTTRSSSPCSGGWTSWAPGACRRRRPAPRRGAGSATSIGSAKRSIP